MSVTSGGNEALRKVARHACQGVTDIVVHMNKVHKLSLRQIADLTGRSKTNISLILRRCDPITGLRKARKIGATRKSTEENDRFIRETALANPYIGLEELRRRYNETAQVKISMATIHRRLGLVGLRMVNVPADTEETRDKKRFPKSQFVRKFEEIPSGLMKKPTKQKKYKNDCNEMEEAGSVSDLSDPNPTVSRPTRKRRSETEKNNWPLASNVAHSFSMVSTLFSGKAVGRGGQDVRSIMAIPLEEVPTRLLPES